MKKANECPHLFKDNNFNKKTVLKSFKDNFFGNFDIELNSNKVIVQTSLPLHFEVKFNSSKEKMEIYAFLRYILNKFDFSFTLEFYDLKELEF